MGNKEKNERNWYQKWWVWAVVTIVLCILTSIPFIINFAYMIGTQDGKPNTAFSATDVLTFYGSLLAFLGTVSLGGLALYQNQRANDISEKLLQQANESEKKSVLPYLSFNKYLAEYEGDILASLISKVTEEHNANGCVAVENTLDRNDVLLDEIHFTISKDRIDISKKLNAEQEEKIKSPFGIVQKHNGGSITVADYNYAKFCVINCGKGSAINTKCRLFQVGKENDENLDVASIPFSISALNKFDIGLYVDLKTQFEGRYMMTFTYYDIYMNCYQQCVLLEIGNETTTINFNEPQIPYIPTEEELRNDGNKS